jgi:hypothetical protein
MFKVTCLPDPRRKSGTPQESLKSELRLQRYGEKNFEDLFVISEKWLGVYLEIFLKTRGLLGNFWTVG